MTLSFAYRIDRPVWPNPFCIHLDVSMRRVPRAAVLIALAAQGGGKEQSLAREVPALLAQPLERRQMASRLN